jgi:DNA-binding HxlR family transcriptional regulator
VTATRAWLSARPSPKPSQAPRLARAERELIAQIDEALDVLRGKWKAHLIFLMARGVHRHCDLLECLPGASKKMMTDTLRALERDGLVCRRVFAEVPPRVEYTLTPLGMSLQTPIQAITDWAEAHVGQVMAAREAALAR